MVPSVKGPLLFLLVRVQVLVPLFCVAQLLEVLVGDSLHNVPEYRKTPSKKLNSPLADSPLAGAFLLLCLSRCLSKHGYGACVVFCCCDCNCYRICISCSYCRRTATTRDDETRRGTTGHEKRQNDTGPRGRRHEPRRPTTTYIQATSNYYSCCCCFVVVAWPVAQVLFGWRLQRSRFHRQFHKSCHHALPCGFYGAVATYWSCQNGSRIPTCFASKKPEDFSAAVAIGNRNWI